MWIQKLQYEFQDTFLMFQLACLLLICYEHATEHKKCWSGVAEGKIPQDAPAILPSGAREEKRKAHFFTPLAKRADARLDRDRSLEKERDRERERDRDSELMPPPGSHKKKSLPPPPDIDQPIDPDEPTYCICGQVTPAQSPGLY
jgi:hypothetical protein